MRNRIGALGAVVMLLAGACSATPASVAPPHSPSAAASAAAAATSSTAASASEAPLASAAPFAEASPSASSSAATAGPSATPLGPDPAEAVIPNVEKGASITFWTFYLSPTFDQYVKDTVVRFKATYPGVEVTWVDHQATFKDDLDSAFKAGKAPDVINLSVNQGWVSEYASKGLLLGLNNKVPKTVQDVYFKGLWNEQLINGENFQFPWYQGLSVELINDAIYQKAGLTEDQFPKTIQGLPSLCKTIFDKTQTVCTIRLTVSDLLSQMVYEAGVKVYNADNTAFAFNSPEGVAWLQMYVDMVKAGTVDNSVLVTNADSVGQNAFLAGASAFYLTSPNLVRTIKASNATLYANIGMVEPPVGKSNVAGKGLMSISVKKDTKFPNASMALAQFVTNPPSMIQFSKNVAVYPSSGVAYDDPYFTAPPTSIEDSARPLAKNIVSTYADIVPTVQRKADVNQVVLTAVQSALFNNVPAKDALDKAVTEANKIIK